MTARDYALIRLARTTLPGWKREASRHFTHEPEPPADPRDYALAEQIAIGVTKNLLLLQWLMTHYSGKQLKQIDAVVQRILAIGLYQLRFLTRIPASAAVNEAVAQAKRFGRTSAAGFINAVLRNATREPDAPLPEPQVALSHPPELFEQLVSLVGTDQALAICRHNNAEPPTIVRLGAGMDVSQLPSEGITITPHERPGMFVVHPTRLAVLSDWSQRGLAQVQDPTAAAVVEDCDVRPGQAILDRCAGLGTKTLQLHEKLKGSGLVVAMDAAEARVATLQRLIADRGLRNIDAIHASFLRDVRDRIPATFDRILIDAPCSNSGVLARRPEARYHQDAKTLRSLETLQLDILVDTAPSVAPDGLLIYSTCSIWPSENQSVIDRFLQTNKTFTKLYDRATLPSTDATPTRYHDGGYVAVLRRFSR